MKRILLILALIWMAAVALPSCESMLDTPDANEVEKENHYGDFNDADNAIKGIYGKLMNLVENVIVLGELRADLMEATENATFDQVDISNHTATAGNKYCDVAPFYEVILNCNDVLANFDRMKKENRLSEEDYGFRYSDVMAVRSWVYLQLAIHFSPVPYITDPLTTVDDLGDDKFSKKNLDEMLVQLLIDMESIPVKGLSLSSPIYQSTSVKSNDMRLVLLNKNFVLGDLHLWSGNYRRAAEYYHNVMTDAETNVIGTANANLCYKVDGWVWNASNEPRFQVCYERYKGSDLNAYRNKWKEIFSRKHNDAELRRECINVIEYNPLYANYPLIELFANTGKGKYQLRPTQHAMDTWESQVQSENNFMFDGRGRESSFDANANGKPVVLKYLYDYYKQSIDINKTIHLNYNEPDFYLLQGRWFIYRAGLLHLRYAEAVNRAGYPDIAYAIVNGGISGAYNYPMSTGAARTDRTGVCYTGYPPLNDTENVVRYEWPFFLDARNTDTPIRYRQEWRDNAGIRGRAFLQPIPKPDYWRALGDTIMPYAEGGTHTAAPAHVKFTTDDNAAKIQQWLEEQILEEAALECGFEGHRWGDLLRIARRKAVSDGADGTAFINNQLLHKGIAVSSLDNCFLPIGKK